MRCCAASTIACSRGSASGLVERAKLVQRPAARQQNQKFLAARKGDRKMESVVGDASDFDFHVAGDRGDLTIGADRKITIERAQRGPVLRIKLNAICHTGVKS